MSRLPTRGELERLVAETRCLNCGSPLPKVVIPLYQNPGKMLKLKDFEIFWGSGQYVAVVNISEIIPAQRRCVASGGKKSEVRQAAREFILEYNRSAK